MAHLIRKTKRLIIRPLKLSDYRAWKTGLTTLLPAKNNWDSTNRDLKTLTLKKFKAVLKYQKQMRAEDQFYDLSIFDKKTGAVVGGVSIIHIRRSMYQGAFIGYGIHNPYWSKGYGKEAALAGTDIAFRDLKLKRLEAEIEPHNRRSIMLIRSIGFRKEGLKKKAAKIKDKWVDLAMYSITSEEFGIKWSGKIVMRPR